MRAFVAIDLPETVRDELETLQNSLTTGRLVPTENLHLTLTFLGEQSEAAIEDAHKALSTIRVCAFDLQLVGLGTFGKRSPQVIYADVPKCEELVGLERRVTRTLRNAGLEFPKRRFRPHVTIARLPKLLSAFDLAEVRAYLEANAAFRGSRFEAGSFQLYRSILTSSGAQHEVLANYDLMGR